MRTVLLAIVVLAIQPLVSAQDAPFGNGTVTTEAPPPDAQVTGDDFSPETTLPDSNTVEAETLSEAQETASAALKGGGGYTPDTNCHPKTVTVTVCGGYKCPCPKPEKTTYVP